MLSPDDKRRLKAAYQSLSFGPIGPDDPRYMPIFEDKALSTSDPVLQLRAPIEMAELGSTQLFSGHRGTGKSTQLRRLKRDLERDDPSFKVVICDLEGYLPMAEEVDVVDFLLGAAGAVSEALRADDGLLGAEGPGDWWQRFVDWAGAQRIGVDELGLSAGGLSVKANLKSDATFRAQVRERTRLHVGAFRQEVHAFFADALTALRERHGDDDLQLVVVLDSLEHLRGTTTNAGAVAESVEELFRGHAEALRVPHLHTIYTVPPWLRLQAAGLGGDSFDGYVHIPCVKVQDREGRAFAPGLARLRAIAQARVDLAWLLGPGVDFDALARASGGYLRDLFRLLRSLITDAYTSGLPSNRGDFALQELRNAYLHSFTNQEALWMARIADTHTVSTDAKDELQVLAHLMDTHLVLFYRNGEDWYDVHPLVREVVKERARAYQERQARGAVDVP